jgi:hypothetical protein
MALIVMQGRPVVNSFTLTSAFGTLLL